MIKYIFTMFCRKHGLALCAYNPGKIFTNTVKHNQDNFPKSWSSAQDQFVQIFLCFPMFHTFNETQRENISNPAASERHLSMLENGIQYFYHYKSHLQILPELLISFIMMISKVSKFVKLKIN